MIDLQCPNNAGGIATLNSHCKPLTQDVDRYYYYYLFIYLFIYLYADIEI